MKQSKYTFTISPSGELKMEYEGVTGSQCLEETKEIEIAIGGQQIDSGKTDDFYKSPDPQEGKIKW